MLIPENVGKLMNNTFESVGTLMIVMFVEIWEN